MSAELTYYRGRVGLHAVLEALGVGPGDEVITQAYTCVAVPEAIMASGARPVYADVEADGVNLDPDSVRSRVGPSTRVMVVQHTFGLPARMDALMELAAEHDIAVIEDCCHTVAGRLDGRALGSFGAAAFYSYEWGKPIVVGVGGSVRANEPELASKLRVSHDRLRTPSLSRQVRLAIQYAGFGVVYHPRLYWPVRSAFRMLSRAGAVEGNYNADAGGEPDEEFGLDMAPMQRALLSLKRHAATRDAAHRRDIVSCYRESMGPIGGRFEEPAGSDVVYARYPVRTKDKPGLLQRARKAGFELAEWYATPIHPLEGRDLEAVGYEPGSCPRAEALCDTVVSLPTHRRVSERYARRAGHFFAKGMQ